MSPFDGFAAADDPFHPGFTPAQDSYVRPVSGNGAAAAAGRTVPRPRAANPQAHAVSPSSSVHEDRTPHSPPAAYLAERWQQPGVAGGARSGQSTRPGEAPWQGSREMEELHRARDSLRLSQVQADEIAPVPEAQQQRQQPSAWHGHGAGQPQGWTDDGRRGPPDHTRGGPFMHYEDYSYFEGTPKEINVGGGGLRGAETFSGDEGGGRPRARRSWKRQRRRRQQQGTAGSRRNCTLWLPEVAWCLLSAVCVAAIAVVLHIHDQRPLPAWPLGITLNTLVAFLATVCRAAFVVPVVEGLAQLKWNWFARGDRAVADLQLFEDASRSPWGSLKLLAMAKGRTLGILAGILLVTGLVSSPLTQSAINYPTRFAPGIGNASIARSEAYYYPDILLTATEDLDIRQKQAIQQGIYNTVSTPFPYVEPTCSTGNCQWSPFGSLAICMAMKDVTTALTVSGPMRSNDKGINLGLPGVVQVRNASLPNGIFLIGGTDGPNLNISSSAKLVGTSPFDIANDVPPAVDTVAFAGNTSLTATAVADFFVIYTNETQQFATSDAVVFRAVEILLHFCVNTYEAAVVSGTGSTRQTASETTVLATTANGTAIKHADGSTTTQAGGAVLEGPSTAGRGRSNYTVDGSYVRMLSNYARATFAGAYSASFGTRMPGLTATSDAVGTAMYNGLHEGGTLSTSGEDAMRAVVTNLVGNVAISMTNAIRSLGTTTTGSVLGVETFVEVRWAWLAFLAGQVALSGLFLVCVAVQTSVWRVAVLKSSAPATLMAVAGEDRAALERKVGHVGVGDDAVELRRLTEGLMARFVRLQDGPDGRGGWVLDLGRGQVEEGGERVGRVGETEAAPWQAHAGRAEDRVR